MVAGKGGGAAGQEDQTDGAGEVWKTFKNVLKHLLLIGATLTCSYLDTVLNQGLGEKPVWLNNHNYKKVLEKAKRVEVMKSGTKLRHSILQYQGEVKGTSNSILKLSPDNHSRIFVV